MKLTARQKERLNRPRPFLFLVVLGLFGLPWIWLFRSGIQSRHQQTEMDSRAATFFAQFPTYQRNLSAQQFDVLGAYLGFFPNSVYGTSIQVDTEAHQAYQAIEPDLKAFLQNQVTKTSGSFDAPPPLLRDYLMRYGDRIASAQAYLLANPIPRWDMDAVQMSDPDYAFASFANVRSMQNLLLTSAIAQAQQGQNSAAIAALEASWRLNQSMLQRPDLLSQLTASIVSEQQAGLLRHLSQVPERWQSRLIQQAQTQSVLSGRQFDTWLQYKISQQAFAATIYRSQADSGLSEKLMSVLAYWFSPSSYLQLAAIDTTQTAQRALQDLSLLTVCSSTQHEAEGVLMQSKTARWNEATALVPAVTALRWKVAGDRALTLELTQKVLQAKQIFQAQGQWPDTLPEIASQACPGEYWVYEHSDTNGITLSFSLDLAEAVSLSGLTPLRPVPLRYETRTTAVNLPVAPP
ncbi:MAG: hypothetical protein WA885_05800 [Phormidesmis sp.]